MFPTNKKDFKKALNFGLLFYAIFGALSGTLVLASVLFVDTPDNEVYGKIGIVSFVALFVYGSCAIALLIRNFIKE